MGKSFTRSVKICLEKNIVAKARSFGNEVAGTVNYGDSNQVNSKRIANDHFISKLGEEAVKRVFEERGAQVQGPDYTIYAGKEKSWQADLIINEIEVAVKTQKKSSAGRYGLSWTFQHSSLRKDPILQNPDAWVCFVECDDSGDQYSCTVFPPIQIKKLPFEAPRLKHLVGKKKVVYIETLIQKKIVKANLIV